MKPKTVVSEEAQRRRVIAHGEYLLKFFHQDYADNPLSLRTENMRGQLTDWKRMVVLLYGESEGEDIIFGVSQTTGLSIPHGGPLSDDGSGYVGFDSYCHMGFIGKLSPGEHR